MKNKIIKKSAFTLLEIILVVALIAISSGIVAPIYYSAKSSDDLNNSFTSLISSLRKAQHKAMASKADSDWGLKISENNIIIFKGSDFSNREVDYDETISFNKNISYSGLDEVVYSKFKGRPNIFGDISLTLNNKEKILNINELGLIDF